MLTGQKGCGVSEVVHVRTIVSTVGHVRGKESVIAWEDKQEEREEASRQAGKITVLNRNAVGACTRVWS